MKVAVYRIKGHHRSDVICSAMIHGINSVGDKPIQLYEDAYVEPVAPVAMFYGLEGLLPKIFADYKAQAKAVYVDLGYWGRRQGGRWSGYHKAVVNSRHPDAYFQSRAHDDSRSRALGVRPLPWKRGRHILLAGMGEKGAIAEGYKPEQWEYDTISQIRRVTSRPIIYRPKPSWKRARPIEGVAYSPKTQELAAVLQDCHAVVTHHSNVAVDGLVDGIPAFTWGGVGCCMGLQDLSRIETPLYPDGREQWIADIAWTQWSIAEMRQGLAWLYLKDEGLLQ